MPLFKWNDTTERMMLIKLVEQNPGLKLDVDAAIATWPSELGAPTKRGIGDRFNLIKKQIRDSNVTTALGQGSTLTTPQSVPATPKARSKSTTKNKKFKAPPVPTAKTDNEEEDADTKPTIVTKTFKSKLLNSNPTNTPSKRKRINTSDSETSMTEHTSSDEAARSPTETAVARRSLPRRSKSKTPMTYADEGDILKHESTDDGEGRDSDGLFDPAGNRAEVVTMKKMGWAERVAAADGKDLDDDDDDDMQA